MGCRESQVEEIDGQSDPLTQQVQNLCVLCL